MADAAPGRPAVDWRLARRMFGYLHLGWVALAIGSSLLIGATTQALPYLQYTAIDHYLAPRAGSEWVALTIDARVAGVWTTAWRFLVVAVIAWAAQYAFARLVVGIGQTALRQIRTDLFAKFQRLPIAFYDRHAAGQLVTRLVSDVEVVNRFVSYGLVNVVQATFVLLAVAGYMLWLSWELALLMLTAVPVIFGVIRFFMGRLRQSHVQLRLREGARNAALNEYIIGMGTLQALNQQEAARLELDSLNTAWLHSELVGHRWLSAFLPTVDLISCLALATLLWYGGGQSVQGVVSLGVLIAFTQYLRNFFIPLQELSDALGTLPSALAGAERIFELLDEPEAKIDSAAIVPMGRLRGDVELNGVWFSYRAAAGDNPTPDWVLRGVDIRVRAGESVALVGATGAGKTSILSLLMRFYDVQRGEVRIDGTDVRRYAQRELRQRFGLVLQDATLFSGTLESNLRLGGDALPFERIVEACKLVGIHDFIESQPLGYQTQVKERGATLSTGQKQLLCFARVLAANPDIILLDEATASVDTNSEQKIQAALQVMLRGRTSIVVAHRLSTVRNCDRIIVMRQGQVVEEGSHQALVDSGGYYAKLSALSSASTGRHPKAP